MPMTCALPLSTYAASSTTIDLGVTYTRIMFHKADQTADQASEKPNTACKDPDSIATLVEDVVQGMAEAVNTRLFEANPSRQSVSPRRDIPGDIGTVNTL